MPIDRAATLRSAEKLLRQGKLEPAIAEYLRIAKEQPRDWNTANIVGDLYVRAGKVEQAIEQYVAIADSLREEGFLPKAAALYKKVLKLKPEHEHALLRCADIAAEQGVLVDARTFLRAVADRRRARGDRRGAAQIDVRIGTLDPNDYPARMRAARTRLELDDAAGAFRDLQDIAVELIEKERPDEATDALREAAALAPDDPVIRGRLIVVLVKAGMLDDARAFARTSNELQAMASELEQGGRTDEAQSVLRQAFDLDPTDARLKALFAFDAEPVVEPSSDDAPPAEATTVRVDGALAAWALEAGGAAEVAGPSVETPSPQAESTWSRAERHVLQGRLEEGRMLLQEVLQDEPARRQDVALLGLSLANSDADAAFQLVDLAADAAIAARDWESAAAGLQELVTRVPSHLPGLMRLVEVSVDGGLSATMYSAQAQLADAYLEAGAAEEARFIAEDLVAREPWERAHLERFRRALVMLGQHDPEGVIARRLSGEVPFVSTDAALSASTQSSLEYVATTEPVESLPALSSWTTPSDGLHLVEMPIEVVPSAIEPPAAPFGVVASWPDTDGDDEIEVDLSAALSSSTHMVPTPSLDTDTTAVARAELDRVLAELRADPGRREAMSAAEQDYQKGLELFTAGEVDESIAMLTKASSAPQLRFVTAALLARIHRDQGLNPHALVWFEQASEAPPPSADEGSALLYDFADLLESTGARARALAVFVDLQSEAPDYRDVSNRVDRLMPVAARG